MSEYLLPAILIVAAVALCTLAETGVGKKGRSDHLYYAFSGIAVVLVVISFILIWKNL